MAVDNKKIRERLAKLQSGSGDGNFEKIDYKALLFKPQLGKQTVRIVPSKFDREYPFKEVEIHNYQAFKKNIYSLSNWGEKDPVIQMRKQLFADETEESKAIAKKIAPRKRTYVNVIVRGQEELGVRLWEFGPQTLEKLLSIMAQEDEYGDITDLVEGTDLTVEGFTATMEGTKKTYTDVNISPKRKTSPLSEDPAEVKEWLDKQKDPLELNKRYTYEEIKGFLNDFLFPEDEDGEDTPKPTKKEIVKGSAPKKKPAIEDEDDDEDLPLPTKKKPIVVDDEDDEPIVAKPKKKPVVVEDDEDDEPIVKKPNKKPIVDLTDDDDDAPFVPDPIDEDEPPVKSKKPVSKAASIVTEKPTAKASAAKRFAEVFDED